MQFHNPNQYVRDCRAVAGFDCIGPGTAASECLTACAGIRDAVAAGSEADRNALLKVLEEKTGVGSEVALVLAFLVENGGYIRSAERLAQCCGLRQEMMDPILSDMFARGMVNQLEDAPGIILSAQAIEMLRRDSSLENLMQEEFMDILRYDADSEDPFDEAVMAQVALKMRDYIARYPESRMGNYFEENGMSGLSEAEFGQFVYLCRDFVLRFTAGCKADRGSAAVKAMINRGWAILFAAQGDSDSDMIKQNNMLLSVGVCRRLFHGMEDLIDFSSIMGQTRVIGWNEIDEKPLFYNAEDNEGIKRLCRMAGEEEYRRIAGALKEHNLKVAVSAILYGGPGTGKTELAKQIARATRRNLIVVDASKTIGSYVGEAERNYRDLFRNFRYIEAVSQRAPIMFIDEADGILGSRIQGAGNSRDRFVNTIQNIILEELSDFEGLLLATTNLASNLDEAMDRRFLVKIEFHAPDEKTRMKIWKSKLPQVPDSDLEVVAREFSFAGGHIDNVATRAIIEAIMDGSDTITLDSLIKFSKDETAFSNKDNRRRIGF